jgi:preprotein translocase subunit SecF
MLIVKYRKIFYAITILLTVLSLGALLTWGLKLGIDFKGGALLEVEYAETLPEIETVRNAITPIVSDASVRSSGENGYLIRMREVSEGERAQIVSALQAQNASVQIDRFDSIGPILGREAANKSIWSIIIVLIAIVLFVSYAFRHVSKPISSWKYGFVTIISLAHDVLIPMGVFAVLGHFVGYEVDTLFVTALLVVLGFSVHDTIVVFDRVRENLKHNEEFKVVQPFEQVVGESINQTFVRSVNTSLTVLLSLVVLYVVGGEATHNFTLTLLIGIAAGTFSSIFLGSPLLVTLEKYQKPQVVKK